MTKYFATVFIIVVIGDFRVVNAEGPPQGPPPIEHIEQGAEVWVITNDIPPFSVSRCSVVEANRAGLLNRHFGSDLRNGSGGCHYRDTSRHMLVGVSVTRDTRTSYLEFAIEVSTRDLSTGYLPEPETSLVSINGNAILMQCIPSSECNKRAYFWRTNREVVNVSASAVMRKGPVYAQGVRLPCPEPVEILEAYLRRYPSTLTQNWEKPTLEWANSEQRARDHLRMQAMIELAAAKYWIKVAEAKGPAVMSKEDLRKVEFHMQRFAELREKNLAGPSGVAKEATKGNAELQNLKPSEQLLTLEAITNDYEAWWAKNVGTKVIVPEFPPEPAASKEKSAP